MVFYVNSQESNSPEEIAFLLNKCILHHPARWSELIFLCIGSDRVTGRMLVISFLNIWMLMVFIYTVHLKSLCML